MSGDREGREGVNWQRGARTDGERDGERDWEGGGRERE